MSTTLRVRELVVEGDAERAAAERVPEALRRAMHRLGQKLAALPSDHPRLRDLTLERLRIEVGSIEELVSDRGADQLAERLFADLTRERR